MMGRAPTPCRFGTQCHRMDCWYAHPEGRIIDSGNHTGGITMRGGRGGPIRSAMGGGAASTPRAGGGGSQGMGGGSVCRFGFGCHRRDCHFSHPDGRKIDSEGRDGAGGGGGGGMGGRPAMTRHNSNNSIGSTRGMSEYGDDDSFSQLSFGSYCGGGDDEQDLKDTWFPKSRDCSCCKGYIYGCTTDICESIGQCTCSIEEDDLDGGSVSPMASSTTSMGSGIMMDGPAVHSPTHVYAHHMTGGISPGMGPGMGAMGPGMGGMGQGISGMGPGMGPGMGGMGAPMGMALRPSPPPPPTGMAQGPMAGVPGGSAPRASPKGGGKECRFGVNCTRPDCSFRHPQGRIMDGGNALSGENFDLSNSGGRKGGGGGSSKGKKVVDQDLMDTWYPDCRDCVCCKGYKHGCMTPSCAEAGLCTSCSGDNTVPSPAPPPGSAADTPTVPSTSNGTASTGDDATTASSPSEDGPTDAEATTTSSGKEGGKGEGGEQGEEEERREAPLVEVVAKVENEEKEERGEREEPQPVRSVFQGTETGTYGKRNGEGKVEVALAGRSSETTATLATVEAPITDLA